VRNLLMAQMVIYVACLRKIRHACSMKTLWPVTFHQTCRGTHPNFLYFDRELSWQCCLTLSCMLITSVPCHLGSSTNGTDFISWTAIMEMTRGMLKPVNIIMNISVAKLRAYIPANSLSLSWSIHYCGCVVLWLHCRIFMILYTVVY
jgi:hypothetical protein